MTNRTQQKGDAVFDDRLPIMSGVVDMSRGPIIGINWRYPWQEDNGDVTDRVEYTELRCYEMEWSSDRSAWIVKKGRH